jgi:hypothetical protein
VSYENVDEHGCLLKNKDKTLADNPRELWNI